MQAKIKVVTDRSTSILISMVLLATALLYGAVPTAFAATNVTNRYDRISDPRVNAVTRHLVGFTYTDFAVPVGSVSLEFCGNSAIMDDICTAPAGFDLSSATLTAQGGEGGFGIHANSTSNEIILSRAAALPTVGPSRYEFNNVQNPSAEGTYYLRIQTFTSTDGTGTAIQEGGVALAANSDVTVSTEVPPHLLFCVGVTITNFDCSSANSYFIDLGELSKTTTTKASSQMVAATNAGFGYTIFATGTTFTSGNNTITPLAAPAPATPGTSQFGINLRSNGSIGIGADPVGPGTAAPAANYNIPDQYTFVPGAGIVSANNSQDLKKFTVSYMINVDNAQPPGVYTTTLTYICLANF